MSKRSEGQEHPQNDASGLDATASPPTGSLPPRRGPRRWGPWLVLLVLMATAAGGLWGWTSGVPEYESVRLIGFRLDLDTSLHAPQDPNAQMAWRVALLESPRLAWAAVNTKVWDRQGTGRTDAEAVADFERRRSVLHPLQAHHVTLTFRHPDPKVAAAGSAALLEVFDWALRETESDARPQSRVYEQIRRCDAETRDRLETIQAITGPYGGQEGLDLVLRTQRERLAELDGAIRAIRRELERTEDPEARKALEEELERLLAERKPLQGHLSELTAARGELARHQKDLEALDRERERLRLLQAQLEARPRGGRLILLPEGPPPSRPTFDPRPALAGRGAVMGAAAALLLVLLGIWIRAFFRRAPEARA